DRSGASGGSRICAAVGYTEEAFEVGGRKIGGQLREWGYALRLHLPPGLAGIDLSPRERLVGGLRGGGSAIAEWAGSSERLNRLASSGPQNLLPGADTRQRFQASVDNFVIGARYLEENPSAALPWLKQGAQDQGYGVLSQIELGNLYEHGS